MIEAHLLVAEDERSLQSTIGRALRLNLVLDVTQGKQSIIIRPQRRHHQATLLLFFICGAWSCLSSAWWTLLLFFQRLIKWIVEQLIVKELHGLQDLLCRVLSTPLQIPLFDDHLEML